VADPRIAEALDDALRFMRVAVFDDQDLEVFESLSEARRERFPEHMRTAVGGDDYADERLSSAARDAVRQISVKGSILLDYLAILLDSRSSGFCVGCLFPARLVPQVEN